MFYSLQKAHNNHLVSCRYERAKLHITAYDAADATADATSHETADTTSHATSYVNVNLLKYSTSIVQRGLHSVYNSLGFPLFTTVRAALRECSGMMCATPRFPVPAFVPAFPCSPQHSRIPMLALAFPCNQSVSLLQCNVLLSRCCYNKY